MVSIINQSPNDLVNKLENNKVKTSIEDLPTDILNKILYLAEDTIEDKINRIENIRDLYSINRIIHQRVASLKIKIKEELVKGSIYEIEWGNRNKEITKELYLINSVYLDGNRDAINIARVEPDEGHQRIFGNYKIVANSRQIGCGNIISYKPIHIPKEVEWSKEPRQLIGITDLIGAYGWEHPDLFQYQYIDLQKNIIYSDTQREVANKYCIVELFRVYKKFMMCAIPSNALDEANNRSVVIFKVSFKNCYKLNNEDKIPHIRPTDIYG